MAELLTSLLRAPPTDPKERRELYEAARTLFLSLETPSDCQHRIFWSGAQLPLTQIGIDLEIFRTLAAEPQTSFSVTQLAASQSAELALVARICKYLAAFGLINEMSATTYSANNNTLYLSSRAGEGGTKHFFSTISPVFAALPSHLAEISYVTPVESTSTAFQKAHATTLGGYDWLSTQPERKKAFFDSLSSSASASLDSGSSSAPTMKPKQWIDVLPPDLFSLTQENITNKRALFIDVGGGTGPQSILLARRLATRSSPSASYGAAVPAAESKPHTQAKEQGQQHGRIILPDRAPILASTDTQILHSLGIEPITHDFFKPQPPSCHGAKMFFLKNIIHDWNDEKCRIILRHIVAAMASDSLLICVDAMLPDQGASWKMCQMDIQMLAALGSVERTEGAWRELLGEVGLRVREVMVLNRESGTAVIVAEKR